MFYIYIYLDPRKSGRYCYNDICFLLEPIYIGKGINFRFKEHRWNRNPFFKNKINKIKRLKLEPIVFKLYENLNEEKSFELETKLIKEIGRLDLGTGPLVNMTDGGEGSSGKILSEETKKKMSDSQSGEKNHNFGKEFSKDHIQKLSKSHMGKIFSEQTKIKMSENRKGQKNHNFGKNFSGEYNLFHKLNNRKVIQIKMLFKLNFKNGKIAEMYNVNKSTISKIRTNKTWSHIKI
jgi:hypothetical protein